MIQAEMEKIFEVQDNQIGLLIIHVITRLSIATC